MIVVFGLFGTFENRNFLYILLMVSIFNDILESEPRTTNIFGNRRSIYWYWISLRNEIISLDIISRIQNGRIKNSGFISFLNWCFWEQKSLALWHGWTSRRCRYNLRNFVFSKIYRRLFPPVSNKIYDGARRYSSYSRNSGGVVGLFPWDYEESL